MATDLSAEDRAAIQTVAKGFSSACGCVECGNAFSAISAALERARDACAGTQCEACRKGYKYENGFHVGNGEWTRCKAVTIRSLTIAELLKE